MRSAIDDLKHLKKGMPHGLPLSPSCHFFRHVIQVGHVAQSIRAQYRVADGVQCDLGTFPFSMNNSCCATSRSTMLRIARVNALLSTRSSKK